METNEGRLPFCGSAWNRRRVPPPAPPTTPRPPVIARRAAVRPVPVLPVPSCGGPTRQIVAATYDAPHPARSVRDGVIVGVDWGGARSTARRRLWVGHEPSPARPRIRQNPLTPRRLPRYPRHEAPPVQRARRARGVATRSIRRRRARRQPCPLVTFGHRRSAPQAPPNSAPCTPDGYATHIECILHPNAPILHVRYRSVCTACAASRAARASLPM